MQDIEKIEEDAATDIAANATALARRITSAYSDARDGNAPVQALLWRVVQNLTMEIADMREGK
jgi:hypothetical protein